MAQHVTSKNHPVNHEHITPDLNPADRGIARDFLKKLFPQAEVVEEATLNYNCHGFTFAPTHHAWYDFAELFIADDFDGTAVASPQPGDVVIYSLEGVLTHSAVVIEVSGRDVVRVQSKWGGIAEVKHPILHVPEIYGLPIVLLRRQSGVPQHPAVTGGGNVSGGGAGKPPAVSNAPDAPVADTGTTEADTAETEAAEVDTADAVADKAVSTAPRIPERFMLMLASTPEVRRRILRGGTSKQGGVAEAFGAAALAGTLKFADAVADSTDSAPDAESMQSEIEKALADLSAPDTQFHLMLASTPEVLRSAASRLPPIKRLIELSKTNADAERAVTTAVIEFFEKPETQTDEQITGLTLFLLSEIPSKEAVVPIARYLATGAVSRFNGSLAVDALKAAVTLVTS